MTVTTDLPTTTTERLLAVADLIEARPALWDQEHWWDGACQIRPDDVTARGYCNTQGCIAGWAVALTPTGQFGLLDCGWTEAGAMALGLSEALAYHLFHGNLEMSVAMMVDVLRRLAGTDERTMANTINVLTADQMRRLFHVTLSTVEYPDTDDAPVVPLPEPGDDGDDDDEDEFGYDNDDVLVGVG